MGKLSPSVRLASTFALLSLGLYVGVYVPWVQAHVVQPYTHVVAMASAAVLRCVHPSIYREGVILADGRFSVQLLNVCNGIDVIVLFAAAVLAFPAPWRRRLGGLLAGLPLLVVANLARVGGLFLTGRYFPDLFATSHLFVWQALLVTITAGVFALYLRWIHGRSIRSN